MRVIQRNADLRTCGRSHTLHGNVSFYFVHMTEIQRVAAFKKAVSNLKFYIDIKKPLIYINLGMMANLSQ